MNFQSEINEVIDAGRGAHGILVELGIWRAQFVLYVPMINGWLQKKMTTALVYSPQISESIVENKTYKTVAFFLLFCSGIRMPNTDSLKLHQVKAQEEFETSRRVNPNPQPKITPPS